MICHLRTLKDIIINTFIAVVIKSKNSHLFVMDVFSTVLVLVVISIAIKIGIVWSLVVGKRDKTKPIKIN